MFDRPYRRDPLTGLWRPPHRGLCSLLPGMGMAPGFGARAPTGIQVVDLGTVNDTGTDSTGTFAFGSFGTATADRKLIGGVSAMDGATVFSASSGTIGGVSGTIMSRDSLQTLAAQLAADVPSGDSGSVLITFSEAITQDQQCALAAVYGLAAGAPVSQNDGSDDGVTSFLINIFEGVPAGHLVVVTAAKRASAQAFASITDNGASTNAWNNLENVAPPDGGARLGMWWKIFEAEEASVTITITGGATSTEYAGAYQVFAPA